MLTKNSKKEYAAIIAAFLNKHGADRSRLTIDGYEFRVSALYEISINLDSINPLSDGVIQFKGNSKVLRTDAVSQVTQADVDAIFYGVAFMSTDTNGDEFLYKIQIKQLKDTPK